MFFLFLLFCVTLSVHAASASDIDITDIQQAVLDHNGHWTAGETWRTQLSPEERRLSLGLLRKAPSSTGLYKLPPYQDLPSSFSWRDNEGNYITSVKDQGLCGSCSYFATCAAAESWLKIKAQDPKLDIDLSEQFVLSCGNVGSCENGAFIEHVHQYMANTGTPGEECFPYRQSDNVPCSDACPGWADQMFRIGDFTVITYNPMSFDEIKNAVFHHPVVAGMDVYKDFNAYTGGVYQHVTTDIEGGHAVLIYGWEDSTQSWLCKNSWGPSWGASGHFRIKWGDSGIGNPVVMIWDDTSDTPVLNVQPPLLDYAMRPGETARQYLKLVNSGTGPLEYVAKAVIATIDGIRYGNAASIGLRIPFGTGTLAAGEWIQLPVEIAMDDYTLGTVRGTIEISTNKSELKSQIPFTIEVKYSENDLAVTQMSLPEFTWPVLLRFSPSIQVKNWSEKLIESVPGQCSVEDSSGASIYTQAANLDSLPASDSKILRFPEFAFIEPGNYKFVFQITSSDDENPYNNSYEAWIRVKDILDDFEQENALWNGTGGWGRTDLLSGGHESKYHMHVNHGNLYENNSQADLTLRFPVDLSGYRSALLSFWLRYVMEKGRDYLFVQASADSQMWVTADSISGNNLRWHEHQTDLSRFTGPEYKKMFIRFRFISNESQTGLGPMIDDVRLKAEYDSQASHTVQPATRDGFALLANFPNPFNPVTFIPFDVAEPSWIKLSVFNVNGQWIDEIVNKLLLPGHYKSEWNGTSHPSGLYIYKMDITTLNSKRYFLSKKMMLVQ